MITAGMPVGLEALRRRRHESATFHVSDREIALYNLSVGELSTAECWRPRLLSA